ncbi:MAG: hypothetical protein LQ346_004912 [Caloplaca aetnensis]|nr:MAG: hypothetical protein LQ346_004912 [Caloplaca aetnensis]
MPAKRKSLQKPKAIDGHPAEPHTSAPSTIAVSKRINEPGNNCFAKADGENGNEQEAKAAINTAITIMRNYSISQADLMEADASEKVSRLRRSAPMSAFGLGRAGDFDDPEAGSDTEDGVHRGFAEDGGPIMFGTDADFETE